MLDGEITELFKPAIQREIVHSLVKVKGRSDIKTIKKAVHEIFSKQEAFDEVLLATTETARDAKGVMSFKLKEKEFMRWYDPYYYLDVEDHAAFMEAYSQVY